MTTPPPSLPPTITCAQIGPEAFMPTSPAETRRAKRVCFECPGFTACHAWALTLPADTEGVVGGTSESDRRRQRREVREAAAEPVTEPGKVAA